MGRLIDEDIVIDIINFECGKWTGLSKTIEKEIKALPPAQPERDKGEWLANGDIPKECPFCGEDWNKYVFGDVWYTGELPKFCPNCGADMREGQDERHD